MTRALEQARELGRSLAPRRGEWCVTVIVHRLGTRTGSQQPPHHRDITTQGRDEKRGSAPGVGRFGAESTAQELIDALDISRCGSGDQR
jgi:hypothetical protein